MLNEIFRLFGTIAINNDDANKAIDHTSLKASKFHKAMNSAFSGIGKAAAVCGKAIVTGLGAGAAAMGTLVVKSMGLAGELEQNMGGSEAVFKHCAQRMQNEAANAYKTMGLSQSEYLASANKMGSIMQGMGFSVSDSADMTVNAMQRAADVASIMGISQEQAMEAIIGMSKKNFTMMDNLGVSMNDTTLAAYALEKGITKSYAAMTDQEKIALAYQMFMEKTSDYNGNFAKEVDTLAGSLGVAKAAWQNFLSGSETTYAPKAMADMVDAFVNVGDVVIKNLNKLLPKLTKGLTTLVERLTPYIPEMLQAVLPGVIAGAVALLTGLAEALPDLMQVIVNELPYIFDQLGKAAEKIFPALVATVGLLFSTLAQQLPTWIAGIGQAISAWWNGGQGLLDLLKGAIEWTLPMFGMPDTTDALTKIETWWDEHIQPHIDTISANLASIGETFASLWEQLMPEELDTVVASAIENALGFVADVSTLVSDLCAWLAENPTIVNTLKALLGIVFFAVNPSLAIAALIITNWETLVALLDEIIAACDTFFSETVPEWWKKQWEDIGTWWNDHIITPINNAIAALKEFLGLNAEAPGSNEPVHSGTAHSVANGAGRGVSGAGGAYAAWLDDNSGVMGMRIPGFATGLDFVPRDNYLARLHYGESVLTKEEATAWRNGQASGIDYDRLAEAMAQRPMAFNVDGKAFAVMLARELSRTIGNRNIQSMMAMGG